MNDRLFGQAPLPLLSVDAVGRLEHANAHAATLLPEPSYRGPVVGVLAAGSRAAVEALLRSAAPPPADGLLVRAADGTPYRLFAEARPSVNGTSAGWSLALVPAALPEPVELPADQAFVARFSHEVRAALAGLVGFADLVHEEQPDVNPELLADLRRSGRHLLDTLGAVMELARLDARAQPPSESVDVTAHARDCVALYQPLANARGLTLWLEAEAEAPAVAEAIFLDRILHNLVDNALKYTEAGRVTVSVAKAGDRVRITVADTGPGVSTAFLPRLFQPFEREAQGAPGSPQGLGLGLSITRSLVERMAGQLFVCSAPGEGTSFTVLLPATEAASEASG